METMRERLIEIMRILKIRNESLAFIMRTSPEQISQYLSFRRSDQGQVFNMDIKKLILLLDHFPELNANYLLTGKGEPFISDSSDKELKLENTIKELEAKLKAKDELYKQSLGLSFIEDTLREELIRIRSTLISLGEELSAGENLRENEFETLENDLMSL